MELENIQKWDRSAGDFQKVFRLGQNDYNQSVFSFWEEEGMLRPGDRVLDIGCGVGKYGVLFAQHGYDVTLLDVSPEMLRLARENMAPYTTPWTTFCGDFDELSGQEAALSDGFELVISTMSPAVHDRATVAKMSRLSRRSCFLSRFYHWEQPLRDKLLSGLRIPPQESFGKLKDDCASVMEAVASAGFSPRLRLVEYRWCDRRSPEEMTDYLLRRCVDSAAISEDWRGSLLDSARSAAGPDGLLDDEVSTQVAWIVWYVT